MHIKDKTAFLGNDFGGMSKSRLRGLLKDALWDVDFKAQWKPAKNTQRVVFGTDASDAERASIAERGLPTSDLRDWVGWDLGRGAQSAREYLQALVDAGFQFSESTTEGDLGPAKVVSLPLVEGRDVVFEWVDKEFGDFLSQSGSLDDAPHPQFEPTRAQRCSAWKSQWSYGLSADQGRLRAIHDERVIPGYVIAGYLREFGTLIRPAYFGAPNATAYQRVLVAGAIEGGGRSVSFVALPVVNT